MTVAGTTVKQGYITRVNLNADSAHRVTLMATKDVKGDPIQTIDGITWDPFAQRLLLTTENASAPTYAATIGLPSQVEDVSGALGRGGYEGVQNDSDGNLWIVEDIGGSNKPGTNARRPNSFVYRYVPSRPGDLHNGKLQVLQVLNQAGAPVTFESQEAVNAPDQVALRTYGLSFNTKWITIHDTGVDGTAPFNANTLAKASARDAVQAAGERSVPPGVEVRRVLLRRDRRHKRDQRPENGNAVTGAGGAGGWASIFKLTQRSGSSSTGKLSLFYEGNESAVGLDNVTFLSRNLITFGEDAGDTLHTQRNGLDSAFVFDVRTNYSAAPSRSGGSPRVETPPPRSTPPTAASARTTATTRPPASTSPTGTRARTASSARSRRASAPRARNGAGSTPSSTATTSPGKVTLVRPGHDHDDD